MVLERSVWGQAVVFSDLTDDELRDEIEAMEVALRWLIQKPLSDGERATLSLKVWAAKAELNRRDDFPALRRPSATHVSGRSQQGWRFA
jgi:hypothetical protein